MHVHPRTSPETFLPATPQLVASRKESAQTADSAPSGRPTMTGLFAQTLKNGRKSASGTEDDSTAQVADGTSAVTTDEQAGSANAGDETAALRTYTATGALSKPPSVAGEVFETTI